MAAKRDSSNNVIHTAEQRERIRIAREHYERRGKNRPRQEWVSDGPGRGHWRKERKAGAAMTAAEEK